MTLEIGGLLGGDALLLNRITKQKVTRFIVSVLCKCCRLPEYNVSSLQFCKAQICSNSYLSYIVNSTKLVISGSHYMYESGCSYRQAERIAVF